MTFDRDADDASRPPQRPRRPGDAHGRGHDSRLVDPAGPKTNDRRNRPVAPADPDVVREPITSRSTDDEARDLLALRRAKRGDDASFASLLRTNDAEIRRFVTAMVGPADLDRVCGVSYLKAYRGLPLAPSTSPRIWLLGIADGACRDQLRRRARAGHRDEPAEPLPIDADLPAEARLVRALVDAAGLTVREAGRLVDGGAPAARALLDLARDAQPEIATLGEAPEHAPGFWNTLGNQLLVERSAPATDSGSLGSTVGALDATPAAQRFSVQSERAARGMAKRVREHSPRAVPWRAIALSVAVVSSIAVVVIVAFGVARHATNRDAELGLTAAKVMDRLDEALGRDAVIAGTATVTVSTDPDLPVGDYHFVRAASGSYRTWTDDGSRDEGFDARAATFTVVTRDGGDVAATVQRGLAPGPPSPTGAASDAVGDLLSDAVRLVRGGTTPRASSTTLTGADPADPPTSTASTTAPMSTSPEVSTTTTPGTAGWTVTARLDAARSGTAGSGQLPGVGHLVDVEGDQVRLTASQTLVLPTAVEIRRDGQVVVQVTFSGLTIGQAADAAALSVPVPDGASLQTSDAGFAASDVGAAREAITRRLRTPAALPDGFVLASVAVQVTDQVAVYGYRNGSRQLTVTSRPAVGGTADAADPFGAAAAGSSARGVDIASGAFAGSRAWFAELPVNHLWLVDDEVVLTVTGDGTAAQLTDIAASMQ